MTPQPIRITLQAQLQSALHIAGPGRAVALVDRPIDLDAAGFPFIPASSIRGRLRAHLERLLKAWGQPVCTPPVPAQMCPHVWATDTAPAQNYCLACRLFGSAWQGGTLMNNDLCLVARQRKNPDTLRMERMSLSIGRRLGTAQTERLFATETTVPQVGREPLCFEGTMMGLTTASEVGWLLATVPTIRHVGGSKARGLGALQITVTEVAWWQHNDWQAVADPSKLIEEALPYATA